MLVVLGKADGLVSGSINSTANTVRPALQAIKTKAGSSLVSGAFLMCFDTHVALFADCAINPNPSAQCLAEIAIQSAQTAQSFDIEPRIGMLSYSTLGSGKGPDVDLVEEATALVHEQAPELEVVGPIQFDAAWSPQVAASKAKGNSVAGHVNVFVFPDLSAGNIAYKAVQRSSGALAVGPVLQGLNKPVNDLSRGAQVADIINTVALTAAQAD
jgi:phosphate acetyltransferase